MDNNYWIEKLCLEPHPEGGYFKETYRATDEFSSELVDKRFKGIRNTSTAIYFLLLNGKPSVFHKLNSDEIWHFYDGGTLKIYIITPEGKIENHLLGSNPENNESFQVVVPNNTWFAAEVVEGEHVLAGCTVSPGFNFEDFELGSRANLTNTYPDLKNIIAKLTP